MIATKDAEDNELPRAFVVPKPTILQQLSAGEMDMNDYTQGIDNWVKERVTMAQSRGLRQQN